MSSDHVHLSIIVPAYNNPHDLHECLSALLLSAPRDSEIIVVDDGSTKEIRSIVTGKGIELLRLERNAGPSSARNYGARRAKGNILFFVDSDLVVTPATVNRLLEVFECDPTVAAAFGSYDKQPRAKGIVSQYRNLLHHYVHQTGSTEASTFWAGCGAVRRVVFEEVGGFDEKRFPRCIEDIELGYRLRRAHHRIVLDPTIQGTHLKRWTLRSVIRTDVWCRAIPWSRLILEQREVRPDLNLKVGQRVSVALVGLVCIFLPLALFRWWLLNFAAAALLLVLVLNRDLYAFFMRERGLLFTLAAIPLHLLYFLYSGLTYLYVWCGHRLRSIAMLPLFKEKPS